MAESTITKKDTSRQEIIEILNMAEKLSDEDKWQYQIIDKMQDKT